ncbi:hypothetical protein X777_06958 [Ooceraea biroi]|uniref:Uncharacterized protein n=1 Tax=Ooceraea biroi TaxID=2015173 RepID=A0A026WBT7_OOCBI|nr:hypothetical protein X777_06958 [Ooceraea biroi]
MCLKQDIRQSESASPKLRGVNCKELSMSESAIVRGSLLQSEAARYEQLNQLLDFVTCEFWSIGT